MSADIIVSYDGTPNDDDALALGQALSSGGASLALAYVRHSREFDPRREELAQHDAQRRLSAGAALLGTADVGQHVVFGASTGEGLEQLATAEGASVIVFGSDYRTAPGRAEPGNTAQRLLEGSPIAIAVARAGLRTELGTPIRAIALAARTADGAARQTVENLAARLGAELVEPGGGSADLLVVGSAPGGQTGRVALSGATRAELDSARGSVLVLACEVPVAL
jgi:nucleotide-binding universal stress UspA family protein